MVCGLGGGSWDMNATRSWTEGPGSVCTKVLQSGDSPSQTVALTVLGFYLQVQLLMFRFDSCPRYMLLEVF